jgi:hypothetical protein
MTEKAIAELKADLAAAEVQLKKMKEACRGPITGSTWGGMR